MSVSTRTNAPKRQMIANRSTLADKLVSGEVSLSSFPLKVTVLGHSLLLSALKTSPVAKSRIVMFALKQRSSEDSLV